jgi:hypothetical protein
MTSSDTGGIPWLRRGWTTMVAERPERKAAQAMPGGEGMGGMGMGDMDF